MLYKHKYNNAMSELEKMNRTAGLYIAIIRHLGKKRGEVVEERDWLAAENEKLRTRIDELSKERDFWQNSSMSS